MAIERYANTVCTGGRPFLEPAWQATPTSSARANQRASTRLHSSVCRARAGEAPLRAESAWASLILHCLDPQKRRQ
jgi:hypothetical protein